MGIVVSKAEAGTGTLILIVRDHGILQTAGLSDDGNSAVSQTHQLAQAAGLEQGRHQECITCRINSVGKCIGVENIGGNLVRILPVKVAEHILIALLTGTQYDKLNIIPAQFIHHICNQIQSLLVGQSGDQTDHHLLVILAQAKLLLQGALILDLLLAEIRSIVGIHDMLVGLRIEVGIVDSVDDTSQITASGAQQSVQTLAVEGSLDLLRIGVAHSRNCIRIDDTALQQIGILICLQLVRGEIRSGKPCDVSHRLRVPLALEFQVVNGDH